MFYLQAPVTNHNIFIIAITAAILVKVKQDCQSGAGFPLPGAWHQLAQPQGDPFPIIDAISIILKMSYAYIPGAWAQRGKPHSSKGVKEGGHQDREPEDQGPLHSKWEHHGQEGDHQAQVDQQKKYDTHQGQESHKNYEDPEVSKFRSHSDPNWRKRNTVEKEDDHMKHVMKKDNEEMRKRMDGHNHMTKHMMKKADAKAKVESKVEPKKRKGKSSKVPLLMGLGLPVLRKRFLNSFQVSITMMVMVIMPIQ